MVHGTPGAGGVATAVRSLSQALEQEGCQLLHACAAAADGASLLWAAARSDIIVATHNCRAAYVAWALGTLLRKPVVVWVHGPLSEVLSQAGASSAKRSWLRWFYRRPMDLVFVSASSRQSFAHFMQGTLLQPARQTVIVNALAPGGQEQRLVARPDGVVRVGYVGRLSTEKNPHLLIAMMRALPGNFQLTVLGEGPLRQAMESAAEDLAAAGRVRFMGHQPATDAFYRTQDVTVVTSHYEGCPMTVLESLQAGVPCVAVPIPSLQEMLMEQAPYLLAQSGTAVALADAVLTTLQRPKPLRDADIEQVLSRYGYAEFKLRWHRLLSSAVYPC